MSNKSNRTDTRACQTEATCSGYQTIEVEIPERRILGFVVRKAYKNEVTEKRNLSTEKGDVISDDMIANRTFVYRCGLIKAINVLSGSSSSMTLYLDGFSNMNTSIDNTKFKFDSKLENGPVVDITLKGWCTRYGDMSGGRRDEICLVFRDQDQMKEFVLATTSAPEPEQSTVSASPYNYARPSSDVSLWPLVAGVVLGVALSE